MIHKKTSPQSSLRSSPRGLPAQPLPAAQHPTAVEPGHESPQRPPASPLAALTEQLDALKRGHFSGSPPWQNPGAVLARLLQGVAEIQTPAQLALYAQTADELQHLHGIDTLRESLIARAAACPLPLPASLRPHALAPLLPHYPCPYPGATLWALGERWGSDVSVILRALMAPYLAWRQTAAGRCLGACVPPGLTDALLQVVPTLRMPQMEAVLSVFDHLPRDHEDSARLLAALLAHSIALFDERTQTESTRGETPQERALRVQQVLHHLCQPPGPAVPGVPQQLARLTEQLQTSRQNIRAQQHFPAAADFEATHVFLMGIVAILPHVQDASELAMLQAAAQAAIAHDLPLVHDGYQRRLIQQKLHWVLGRPDVVSASQPAVDEVSNVLRLSLVAPSVSLNLFLQSCGRVDIHTLDGLHQLIDNIVLARPSEPDQRLLQALDEHVGQALKNHRQSDSDRQAIKALRTVLASFPAEQQARICQLVRSALGLEQAPAPGPVALPLVVQPAQARDPPMPAQAAVPQPRDTGFQAKLSHAIDAHQTAARRDNQTHNRYAEWLITLVPAIESRQDVDALEQALGRLPGHWNLRRVTEAIRLEVYKRRLGQGPGSQPAPDKASLSDALASLRALLR